MVTKKGRAWRTSLPAQVPADVMRGDRLIGDDYTREQIVSWCEDEKESFFIDDAGNSQIDPYYSYMRSLTPRLGRDAIGVAGGSDRTNLVLGPRPRAGGG